MFWPSVLLFASLPALVRDSVTSLTRLPNSFMSCRRAVVSCTILARLVFPLAALQYHQKHTQPGSLHSLDKVNSRSNNLPVKERQLTEEDTLILFSSRLLIFSRSAVDPSGAFYTLMTPLECSNLDKLGDLHEGKFTCIA